MNRFDDTILREESFSMRDLQGIDRWMAWTVTRTSWTDVGTPTVTASFRDVGRHCFFQIKVVPGTSIATAAGTSYTNLPIPAKGIGGVATMQDLTANTAVGNCVIDAANSRVYPPAQTASGHTFTICGWYQI